MRDRSSTPSGRRDVASSRTSPSKPAAAASRSPSPAKPSPEPRSPETSTMPRRKPVPLPKEPSPPPTLRERAVPVESGAIPIVRDFAPTPADRDSDPQTHARERREAVLRALEILGSVSRGLRVPASGAGSRVRGV